MRAGGLVGLASDEHGEDDVAAAAGQADEGGVVAFAFGSFAVVEGFGGGVAQGGEGGQEHSVLEPVVSAAALGFAVEGLAGLACDRGQAGVGGELAVVGEAGAVAGLGEDPGYPAAQAAVGATLELPGRIIFSGPCY